VLISPKHLFFTKFEDGYQNNAEFYADFETVEKNAKNSLTKKLQAKKGTKFSWEIFSTLLCELLPLSPSLWFNSPPLSLFE
jgi:hypothetical protein